MKRLKYLLLIAILAFTVGCQKENKELFTVETKDPDPVLVEKPDKFEDVNFDGHDDLLICLGYLGPNAGLYWCAYLYERGNYVYNESFERISAYELEYTGKIIISRIMK